MSTEHAPIQRTHAHSLKHTTHILLSLQEYENTAVASFSFSRSRLFALHTSQKFTRFEQKKSKKEEKKKPEEYLAELESSIRRVDSATRQRQKGKSCDARLLLTACPSICTKKSKSFVLCACFRCVCWRARGEFRAADSAVGCRRRCAFAWYEGWSIHESPRRCRRDQCFYFARG